MDFSAVTKLPPKRLALIAGVGIGGGLLWKHHAGKTATASPGADGTVDLSKLALEQNSAGNLAAAQTQQVPSTNDATRDVGQGTINLPVVRYTVMIGGHEFLTDGTTVWNIDGSVYTPPVKEPSLPQGDEFPTPPSSTVGQGGLPLGPQDVFG